MPDDARRELTRVGRPNPHADPQGQRHQGPQRGDARAEAASAAAMLRAGAGPGSGGLSALQRSVGNRAVGTLVAGGAGGAGVIRRLAFERTWSGALSGALSLGYRGDPDAERWQERFQQLAETVARIGKTLTGSGVTEFDAALAGLQRFIDDYRTKTVPHTQRTEVGALIEKDLQTATELEPKVQAAVRTAARQGLVDKKRQEHAKRVGEQASDYDTNPGLSPTMYVAPHSFHIAGHDQQRITSEAYGAYARQQTDPTGQGPHQAGYVDHHYMSGLTLNQSLYDDRMAAEHADESVPDHRGHSSGYFESKYTDSQRASFNPATDYGTPDITGKGTEQVFHPGKHNPYQSDFNLEHRLTGGVPADSPTGAYTSVSSKFKTDALSQQALRSAKQAAALELKNNPAAYRSTSGKFFKSYSVTLDLGIELGVGFEGAAGTGKVTGITDLFGNNSAYEGAFREAKKITNNDGYAQAAADAAKRGMEQGQDRPAIKARVKAAVNGRARAAVLTDPQANNIAKAAEGAKTWGKADISSIPSAEITATQTGLTLRSIDPTGDNAVFEEGAGQHYPARRSAPATPVPFRMVKFGNETLP